MRIINLSDRRKVIGCGKCGAGYSNREFEDLQYIGVQRFSGGTNLELRNCPCGSTISKKLEGLENEIEAAIGDYYGK